MDRDGDDAMAACLHPDGARPRRPDGSPRRGRLRVPHRSAPASRSRPRRRPRWPCSRPSPTTKAWARTGNARRCRKPGRWPGIWRLASAFLAATSAVRLAARPRFRRGSRHPRDEAPHRRAQGRRASGASAITLARMPATTSSSGKAASAKSSSWRRHCNWSGAGATRHCVIRRRSARCGCWPGPATSRAGRRRTGRCVLFLRSVEHRLQMVADRQTHRSRNARKSLARFAVFMGSRTPTAFATHLLGHLGRVRAHYAEVFERVPDLPTHRGDRQRPARFPRQPSVPEHTVDGAEGAGLLQHPSASSPRVRAAGRRATSARSAPTARAS